MPQPTGYYNQQLGIGSPPGPVYRPDGTLDEAALRGSGQTDPGGYVAGVAPIAAAPTYTNGNTFAGTGSRSNPGGGNVPMSDAAYALLSNNGTQPIPTDKDVLGGGKFGVRGWMNDHPLGVIAAFTALAAGGAALTPAAGGAGGAAGGAGAAEAGAGVGFGGAGTAGIPANLAADFAGTTFGGGAAGSLAASGAIAGGAGAASGVPSWLSTAGNYADNLNGLVGGGGSGGGGAAPMPMFGSQMGQARMPQQQAPRQSQLPILQGTQPQLQAVGRRPYQFRGTTVWM